MKRILFYAAIMVPVVVVAHAQPAAPAAPSYPMQVSSQDQTSLRQICALAQKDASLTLEQTTGIGQYCLGLVNRIGLALSAAKPSDTKAAEPQNATPRPQSPVSPKKEGK